MAASDEADLSFCLALRNATSSSSFKDLRLSFLEPFVDRAGLVLDSALLLRGEPFFELIDLPTLTANSERTGGCRSGRKAKG